MANEAAAHREYAEKLCLKHHLSHFVQGDDGFGGEDEPNEKAMRAIDEAVRTALEKAAQAVMPEDFDKGSSEWRALCAAQAAIRSIVLRAEDVREEG